MIPRDDMVSIHRARPQDVNSVYRLVTSISEFAASGETRFFKREELKEWIGRRDSVVLVAQDKGNIIGFLFAKIISKHWCMLDSIAVNPRYRNKGIGKQLLDKLYAILKRKGVDYMQGLVDVGQGKTRAFWKKRGFKEGNSFVWIEKYL